MITVRGQSVSKAIVSLAFFIIGVILIADTMLPRAHAMLHPGVDLPQDHLAVQIIKLVSGLGLVAQDLMKSWWGWIWERVRERVPKLTFGGKAGE